MFTIDTHTHIIPKHVPDFAKNSVMENLLHSIIMCRVVPG